MNFGIPALVGLAIMLMGLLSILLIHYAKRGVTDGHFKKLLDWMFITVFVSGFPLAVWTFLVESEMIVISDPSLLKIPASIFVLLFFGFILKTAVIAKELGEAVSFKHETASIKNEMSKRKKK